MKETIIILFPFFVLINTEVAGQNNLHLFKKGDRTGVRDSYFKEVIPPIYDDIGWSDGTFSIQDGTVGFKVNNRWGIISESGKQLVEAVYQHIIPLYRDMYRVSSSNRKDNLLDYGIINRKGKYLLPIKNFSVDTLGGNILVGQFYGNNLSYRLFNKDIELLIGNDYHSIEFYRSTFICKDHKKRYWVYDKNGKGLLDFPIDEFDYTGSDFLIIRKKGAYGLIDLKIPMVFSMPDYKAISINEGQPVHKVAKRWEVYDIKDRKYLMSLMGDSLTVDEDLIVSHLNSYQRFYDRKKELFKDDNIDITENTKRFRIIKNTAIGSWSVYNLQGEGLINHVDSLYFDGLYIFSEKNGAWDIYNSFGRRINHFSFEEISPSQNAIIPVKKNNHWGFIDFTGESTVSFSFDSLSKGINNSFPVKYIGEWGVVNAFNEWIIKPFLDSVHVVGSTYVGYKNRVKTLYSSNGGKLTSTTATLTEKEGYIEICQDGSYGLITYEGKFIYLPFFKKVGGFDQWFYADNGYWVTLKDAKGHILLDRNHSVQELLGVSEDYFLIKRNSAYGFIDAKGRLRIANRYDSASLFNESRASIKLMGHWGGIDNEERLVIQPIYDHIESFHNGLAIVRSKFFGIIDKEGDVVMNLNYESIQRNDQGSYNLRNRDGDTGLADKNGRIVIAPNFDQIHDLGDGLIEVNKGGKKAIFDDRGKTVLSFKYDLVKRSGNYLFLRLAG